MDNFRRVRVEKPIVFVRTIWSPSEIVVNSFTAPEDREYEFSTGYHYLNPENITITYDIYDCYSDSIPNRSNTQFYVYNGGGCRIGIDDADQAEMYLHTLKVLFDKI